MMKSSDNKKLTYIVVAMCFMLLVFGVSIGYNLTRNNRNYSGVDEPKLGEDVDPSGHVYVTSIRLDETSRTIKANNGFQLHATVNPSTATNSTVVWSTSDGDTAYVTQAGWVQGRNPGSVTIKACAQEDSSICASARVTVIAESDPTPIAIFGCPTSMVVGETKTLSSVPLSSGTELQPLRWSTNTGSVIDVDIILGKITAKAAGAADVYAHSISDDYSDSEHCTFTVKPKVASISITPSSSTEIEVGNTKTFTATVSPSDATSNVSWSTSDSNVATVTVSGGVVTGKAPGTATITATATDGSGVSASVDVTVVDNIFSSVKVGDYIGTSSYYLALPVSTSDNAGSEIDVTLYAYSNNIQLVTVSWKPAIKTIGPNNKSTAIVTEKTDTSTTVKFKAVGEATVDNCPIQTAYDLPAIKGEGTANSIEKKGSANVYIYCKWTEGNLNNLKSRDEYNSSYYYVRDQIESSRDAMRFKSGCYAYENVHVKDGKYYYEKYFNRCCGTSGGGTTTKSYACYANAPTIEYATQAQWLSEKTGVYQYQLAGVEEPDCRPSACYKNGTTLENSTDVKWFRVDQVPSGYTVVSGVSRDNCVKADEGCYGNAQTYAQSTHVTWSTTRPNGYYKLAEIGDKPACKDPEDHPACYLDTASGEYVWGDYRDKGTLGFEFVPSISVKDYCKKPAPELNFACYKDNNGIYYWGDYSGESGYTLISGIDDSTKCGDPQEEACYKNGDKYEWGTFVNVTGYKLEETIRSSSECQNEACYKNKTSGNYEWGKHANDDNYTLVSNLTNKKACNNDIDVPLTAANVETVIYVGIAVLVMAGLTFMYYAFNNKHEY